MTGEPRRALLFVAWGDAFVQEVLDCIAGSELPRVPLYLLTDETSHVPDGAPLQVIRTSFRLHGKLRKAELIDHLPEDVDTWMFLDSDTRVLGDLDLGFRMAERHGLALALAPHGTLETFRGFGEVFDAESVPRGGQAQFNTGVVFFARRPEIDAVFEAWRDLCLAHADRSHSDQPYFSLVLERQGVVPYTLSAAFNYRGIGEWVAGPIRVWHTRDALPAGANDSHAFRRVREGEVLLSSGRPTALDALRGLVAALLVVTGVLFTVLASRGESLWAWLQVPNLLALVLVLGAPRLLRRVRGALPLLLSATVLLALVVLPELGLRVAGFQATGGVSSGPPRAARFARFVAHEDLLWTRDPHDSDVNDQGFPGPELPGAPIPGTRRLLFLGDSCTAQGFPARVQDRVPGTEAVTLACQAYSSLQGLRAARLHGVALEPEVVFVEFGWNDHWRARGLPDAEREAPSTRTRLVERSRLLQLLARRGGGGSSPPSEWPRVSPDAYRANLEALIATFEGIPVVLVTAPSAHATLGVPDYLVEEGFAPSAEAVLEEHAAYNRVLREVATAHSTSRLLDLAAELDARPAEELQSLFRPDGIHFTDAGLDEVARLVAAFLREQGLVGA